MRVVDSEPAYAKGGPTIGLPNGQIVEPNMAFSLQRPTMATPLSASLGFVMKRSQARVLRRSLGLFDFADSFHDFGHRMVLLFRQLIDKLQNLRRRLVLFRIRLQFLFAGREFDPPQVMSELGR